MTNNMFEKLAKAIVYKYTLRRIKKTDPELVKKFTVDDVYIVWSCKTLQNNKAMVSTNVIDGMYYEVTHNGDTKEIYLDAYKKQDNIPIDVSRWE